MRSLTARFFRWHRWLGYAVAVQVLLWVAGGAVFAWLPFQPWVKAQDTVSKPALQLPPDWAGRLARGLAGAGDATIAATDTRAVQAVATAQGPAWRLRTADGERWLTLDGQPLPPPDATAVATFARGLYKGPPPPVHVQALAQAPSRLGIVREAPGGRTLWLARFDDALGTRLYLDARSGELLAVRTEAWVWYDFFWRLHVMDYADGEDFNNPLLRGAALLALGLVGTGAVLLAMALRRAMRRHG